METSGDEKNLGGLRSNEGGPYKMKWPCTRVNSGYLGEKNVSRLRGMMKKFKAIWHSYRLYLYLGSLELPEVGFGAGCAAGCCERRY